MGSPEKMYRKLTGIHPRREIEPPMDGQRIAKEYRRLKNGEPKPLKLLLEQILEKQRAPVSVELVRPLQEDCETIVTYEDGTSITLKGDQTRTFSNQEGEENSI